MKVSLAGKKILFATIPGDGHINPLSGLAIYLKEMGGDVRWYTSKKYKTKMEKWNIPLFPFKKALDVTGEEFEKLLPEREKQKSKVAKLKFDLINVFISRAPEYYADLKDIHKEFPFDAVVTDCTFLAIPFIKHIMKIPVINIGVLPLIESSKDLAPTGLGMQPARSFFGKLKQRILRAIARKVIFGEPNKVLFAILDQYGIPHKRESVFDMSVQQSTVFLQSGTPGFEYPRTDLSSHIRFIGPLLPYSSNQMSSWYDHRLTQFRKIVLVTQGTVEKDVNKILVPTLEAFKGTDTLVIATTGGSQTEELKQRYQQSNIIIEDFIPFSDIMQHAHVYITNGGYGGVLLSIKNRLPVVVAGVHEGKNEIAARAGYFKIGVNLKTEIPKPAMIRKAVEEIFNNAMYRDNVNTLADEFSKYDPNQLFARYVIELLSEKNVKPVQMKRHLA